MKPTPSLPHALKIVASTTMSRSTKILYKFHRLYLIHMLLLVRRHCQTVYSRIQTTTNNFHHNLQRYLVATSVLGKLTGDKNSLGDHPHIHMDLFESNRLQNQNCISTVIDLPNASCHEIQPSPIERQEVTTRIWNLRPNGAQLSASRRPILRNHLMISKQDQSKTIQHRIPLLCN